jgi:serine/threonine-protein kinase
MSAVAKRIPPELAPIVEKAFAGFKVSSVPAPQGQNSFCFNLRLEGADGKHYLLKAIRLNKATVGDKMVALEEVKAAAAVRSQYFVPLLDSKSVSGYALLLFPFLDGVNLAEHLMQRGTPPSEADIVEMGIALLRGVADLSRHSVQHQDIKPENIFITASGSIKILDFGSARFNKPSYRGTTNTNRSHSAPEQLLASRPINLEALRLTCDERSDVYSVGSVLYLMAKGVTPFTTNDEKLQGGIPALIGRADISDGVTRIISRLLSYNPRYRPQATIAASFLEAGDVQPLTMTRSGFFYNASTSIKRLLDVHAEDETLYQGIIADASKFSQSDAAYLRSGQLPTIIDPQTYLFQAPKLINKKFKKLPYYQYGVSGKDVGVEHVKDIDGLINSVFDFETSAGSSALVPPFFLIKEFNDASWTFDADVTSRALELYKEHGLQLPVLKGVAIAENILLSDISRERLIGHLTTTAWLPHTAGYFVLLESTQQDGLPNEAWLRAAKELLLGLLSTSKTVIWSHAYLPAIVFAHSGVGMGMGEGISQRSFSLNESGSTMKRTTPHLYLPKIFARTKWPTGIRAMQTHGYRRTQELACPDSCCVDIDFNNPSTRGGKDLAQHTIQQLGLQFKKYSGTGGAAKEKADLLSAKAIYDEFKNSPNALFRVAMRNELKPESGTFLDVWLNAFHGS